MENEQVTNIVTEETAQTDGFNAKDTEFGGLKIADAVDSIGATGSIFNKYLDKSILAKSMVSDMARCGYYREKGKGRNAIEGLKMSDEQPQVGALSIGPALSTLFAELNQIKDDEAFRLVLNEKPLTDIKIGNIKDLTVFNIIQNSIMQLLAECYYNRHTATNTDPYVLPDEIDAEIIFEATPFYKESDDAGSDNVKWKKTTEKFDVKTDTGYETHTCRVGGYLDTASWVFVVAKLARSFLHRAIRAGLLDYESTEGWKETSELENITSTAGVLKVLNDLYLSSLRFACRCIVYNKENYVGWTFTYPGISKPEFAPDLYLSYAASTMYLSLYNEYAKPIDDTASSLKGKNVLDELRLLEQYLDKAKKDEGNLFGKICKEYDISDKKTDYFNYFASETRDIGKLQNFVEELWERIVKPINSTSDELSDMHTEIVDFLGYLDKQQRLNAFGMLNSIEFLYRAVNGNQSLLKGIEDTTRNATYQSTPVFTILKEASLKAAEHFWGQNEDDRFKKNMALGPCYADGKLAAFDSYDRAGHSNVLFNNLFAIGLIVNSAYDAEILKTNANEYEDMLQAFQIAVQDTQRRYNLMCRSNTEYKVNSYMLEFAEKVDDDSAKIASKLRRVNITGCYLLPILFKTNGIIEDYLVQYPQKEMVKSFKTIIANRKKKGDNDFYWVWDKEGYNAISNYYYVDALISFYGYYEKYEAPFIKKEKDELDKAIEENRLSLETDRILLKQEYEVQEQILREEKDTQIDGLNTIIKRYEGWQKSICDFIVGGIAKSLNESLLSSLGNTKADWIGNKELGETPSARFVNYYINKKNMEKNVAPDFSALLFWFARLQLTSILGTGSKVGIGGNPDDQNNFSRYIDNLQDDEAAMNALNYFLQQMSKTSDKQ